MIINKTFQNGLCLWTDIYDLELRRYQRDENGVIVIDRAMTEDEVRQYSPQPLNSLGALATLLAVKEVLSVQDAANAVGLTPIDLENEARGWAAAG